MNAKKRVFPILLGCLSLAAMAYNFWAYSLLKKLLIPTLIEITPRIDRITIGVILSITIVALFHLFLLKFSLKLISTTKQNYIIPATFFVGVICSGLLLLNDAALLSDLGKEYRYWDVTQEWSMLFIVSALHLGTVIVGLILMISSPTLPKRKLFTQISNGDEGVFIITNLVGLICAILGLLTLLIPSVLILPERFQPLLYITLAILAIAPFITTVFYWLIRNRKQNGHIIMDEKQLKDAGVGAAITAFLSFLILIIYLSLSIRSTINLNNPIYIIALLFSMLLSFSGAILCRFHPVKKENR